MGELFAEIGDLVFTLVIGYISAIEFLYVVRHLYHYSCNHDANADIDAGENMTQLQDSMRQQLANAKSKEASAGTQVMKDGVPYKDGYRLEAQQALIDQLKEQLKDKELSDMRRQELEKELAKQKKIAEQLRKELAEAEAKYQRQLKEEEEAKAKKLLEEQKKCEREEREKKEAEEQARKLAEAEKQKEAEQRKREEEQERIKKEAEQKEIERKQIEEQQRKEAEEQARKLAELEKQREAEQRRREEEEEAAQKEKERLRQEAEEQARKLQEAEKQRELEQRLLEEELEDRARQEEERKRRETAEAEENERRLLEIEKANEEKQAAEEAAAELAAKNLLALEHRLEEQLRAAEKEAELTEKERQLIESIKKREFHAEDGNEHKEAELLRKILEAREQLGEESEEEQSLRLIQRERDQEAKQRRIEENALLFLEAEKEMADLQSKMLDAVEKRVFTGSLDSAPQTPIIEEPCIRRNFSPLSGGESAHSTVKTQLAQDLDEPYSVRTKPLLFPGISDDTSSIDPVSSQQSSFSTQLSEEITTGTDSQYPVHERQEPDGEDTNLNNLQYSDDYLRSLDGIKQRPLVREDGSGRRRAFKKRRSSNSSNSSRDSRHSRDEELKMFTSLEEEEMKDHADSEFTPIRYTTEPTLKVKGHHRRHKRSPAKDMRRGGDDSLRSSLERLGEETSDPWGEVKPEHYKQTEFWKREKALSIDEEMEFEKPASSEEVAYDTATNMPSASSFEEATQKQNQQALTSLQQYSAQKNAQEGKSGDPAAAKDESARSDNTNLQISQTAEKETSPARSSSSRRLRHSPNIEETDQYEENLKESKDVADKSTYTSVQNTPTINVQTPLDFGPWRDEYGLIMEGLSDFYDFTASVNPSRSRSASRNVSPANTAPNTPLPKDVSLQLDLTNGKLSDKSLIEIYDDTDSLQSNEFKKENIIKFIDSLSGSESKAQGEVHDSVEMESEVAITNHLQYVADDAGRPSSSQASLLPLVNIIDDDAASDLLNSEDNVAGDAAMNTLVSSLRLERTNRSRSRSKSPLPTPDNLKRSVENRRYKMIKHNEDILEKLIESNLLPEITPAEEPQEKSSIEKFPTAEMSVGEDSESSSLVQSLQVDNRRSRSKSPMRLPTPENLSKGLEKRRSKLIERNDELIKQLEERSQTPESPTITVEHVYEMEATEEESSVLSLSSHQTEEPLSPTEEENCSRENMDLLVQSLRAARSRTSSKSPMRLQEVENLSETSEKKTFYGFQQTEHVATTTQHTEIASVPTISIIFSEPETEPCKSPKANDEDDCSREKMDLLIQSLRIARSRSTSKSPMYLPREEERAKTPEPSAVTEIQFEAERSRHSRSKSPSRSHSESPGAAAAYRSNTPSRSLSPEPESYDQFHVMLNLEGSHNRTLSIDSEEQESLQLTDRQRQLDEEALGKLRNASQEMELRTLSPVIVDKNELSEQLDQDYLAELPLTERTKLMKKSPTTPDYDRTISEEMRDVERIKQERIKNDFKRSTYVGESMDLGSEFEPLRKEAAKFQRSRSPSPSFSAIESATAQRNAEEKRKIQNIILQELTTSGAARDSREFKSTGAVPKKERLSSCEIELSLDNEVETTRRIKEEISVEYSQTATGNLEELRRKNAEFRKSTSTSRSPLNEAQLQELAGIEVEATKRIFKDQMLDEVSFSSENRSNFSLCLNTDFLDHNRRASDSALMKLPQILVQHNRDDVDLEPEEYHHYRRFSLAQEETVEQYPADDYIFIEQVEVRTRSGSRTWLREDFYSENVEEYLNRRQQSAEREEPAGNGQQAVEPAADDDEEYSNASDDDRQTVVEVDDEIDEDISDFNERGPAEESHHETSECEEAEREMDRYAGREASDWNHVVSGDNMVFSENRSNELLNIQQDEGAVGGLNSSPYDSDSFAIDQIYDEAIKNRKPSGILREYDNILMQMSVNSDIDEQYLLWSKTNDKRSPKNIEFNTQFLDNERKNSEMRYLGDANIAARQSARLRSRYGYNPVLQAKCVDDDLQVDLNYKPKREYNWRKNFKLDEDAVKEDKEITWDEIHNQEHRDEKELEVKDNEQIGMELRKFSLGGESVTLFSRSPEKSVDILQQQCEANEDLKTGALAKADVKEEKPEKVEKLKKKKTKKKSHKESKAILEETMNREDEDAYDNQVYSRRSSSLQMDTDSPKRKSRSRRSSKSSVTNEDCKGLFSPRSSIACTEGITDILEEFTEVAKEPQRPKKMKKRKKVKEIKTNLAESPIEIKEELQYILEPLNDIQPVSAAITPDSCTNNVLSTLSPQNSVCVTPDSIDTDVNLSMEDLRGNIIDDSTNKSSSTTDTSPSEKLSRTSSLASAPSVDTFDILKDASFYPLF